MNTQTDSNGVVVVLIAHDDLGENKVCPGTDERGENRVNNDRLRHRKNDLPEDLVFGCAVDGRRLVKCSRNGIEEALGDLETETCAAAVAEHQCDQVAVEVHDLEQIVDSDHGHKAGEHAEDHGDVHQGFTNAETQTAECIGNSQNRDGGDNAAEAGNYEGVHEPLREVQRRGFGTCKQVNIVLEGEPLGQQRVVGQNTTVGTQRVQQKVNERCDPNKAHNSKNQIDDGVGEVSS